MSFKVNDLPSVFKGDLYKIQQIEVPSRDGSISQQQVVLAIGKNVPNAPFEIEAVVDIRHATKRIFREKTLNEGLKSVGTCKGICKPVLIFRCEKGSTALKIAKDQFKDTEMIQVATGVLSLSTLVTSISSSSKSESAAWWQIFKLKVKEFLGHNTNIAASWALVKYKPSLLGQEVGSLAPDYSKVYLFINLSVELHLL